MPFLMQNMISVGLQFNELQTSNYKPVTLQTSKSQVVVKDVPKCAHQKRHTLLAKPGDLYVHVHRLNEKAMYYG